MKILSVEYARLKQPGYQHVILLMHRHFHFVGGRSQWVPIESDASHRFFLSQLVHQFGPPAKRWRIHHHSRLTARFQDHHDAMLFRLSVNPSDYDAF